ncbi:MAG: PmoA family protein [Microcella sp.]|uniref:DUF6807 family protein n=1 Tax=Microcella sp. TaxID=1913979 RepID=UPI0024CC378E|nr:DUF6807 family protein [Microcella sp.]UYN82736.1 MAG: PmoA family protein [Microcella sp.]
MTVVASRELASGVVLNAPEPGCGNDSPRPWVHPLSTPSGVRVTDDQPLDHPWHRGLSFAVANVDAADAVAHNFWGGPTFSGAEYVQLANNGTQRLIERRITTGASREELEWCTTEGRVLVRESRHLRLHDDGAARGSATVLKWSSSLVNASATPLRFGSPTTAGRPSAGYGGLFLRGAPGLIGAELLIDGEIVAADAAMGMPGAWAALRSAEATVAIAAHAANPVSPSPWFVRVDPVAMLCAAPFFDEEWLLDVGGRATWQWTVLAIDGAASAGELEGLLA